MYVVVVCLSVVWIEDSVMHVSLSYVFSTWLICGLL